MIDLSNVISYKKIVEGPNGKETLLIDIPTLTDEQLKELAINCSEAVKYGVSILEQTNKRPSSFLIATQGSNKKTMTSSDAERLIERTYLVFSKVSLEASIRDINISKLARAMAKRDARVATNISDNGSDFKSLMA